MAIAICFSAVDTRGQEVTRHGTTDFPIACYHDRLPLEIVPWHWHEEWEAVVVEQGAAVFSVYGRNYPLQTGEGVFVNASALHNVRDAGKAGCLLHSVVFHPRLVGGGLESVFWQRYVQPLLSNGALKAVPLHPDAPWQRDALDAIEGAWHACEEERPGYELKVRSDLSRLAFLLTDHCLAEAECPGKKALRSAERAKTMLRFIQTHYAEPLTVSAIAQSAAVSESECLRCFSDILRTAPIQYLRQYRIQRASELLKTTDLKIAEIGALCGFQEMSYFSRSFREAKGCTPKAYRQIKANRENQK